MLQHQFLKQHFTSNHQHHQNIFLYKIKQHCVVAMHIFFLRYFLFYFYSQYQTRQTNCTVSYSLVDIQQISHLISIYTNKILDLNPFSVDIQLYFWKILRQCANPALMSISLKIGAGFWILMLTIVHSVTGRNYLLTRLNETVTFAHDSNKLPYV
jgi:hypothetical protein